MSHEIIKIGVLPNDGKGDTVRVAFDKINHNFTRLYTVAPELTPDLIVTGNKANDGSGDSLKTAFDKLNKNFTNLFPYAPEITPVKFGATDPLRTTFERVNSVFNSLFEVLAPNEPTVIEVIDPTVEPQPIVNDASFVGNINITNYNIYVNEQDKTKLNTVTQPQLAAPESPLELAQAIAYGNQEMINVGALPNDGTGDPLRVAFQKINNNFSNLFFTTTNTTVTYTAGLIPNQIIYQVPVTEFTQGSFQIKSSDTLTNSSQDITLTAQLLNNKTGVKFTGYGTTFAGSYVTQYDMDVVAGNVRILVSPILDTTIQHFIASQVTFISSSTAGLDIALDGYPYGSLMATQDDLILETET